MFTLIRYAGTRLVSVQHYEHRSDAVWALDALPLNPGESAAVRDHVSLTDSRTA
jgi:hypothetical protein